MTSYILNNKLSEVQISIDETTHMMKENIEKVLQRDESLLIIEAKADDVKMQSHRFHKKTNKLKWQMCCIDKRLIVAIVSIILFLILILVVIFIKK